MGHEGIGVRPRPRLIIARDLVGIARHRGLDLRDQALCGFVAFDQHDGTGRIAEPAAVRRPAVGANGQAPADLVVARVAVAHPLLHHDPGVMGEDAAPAADAGRIDGDDRLGRGSGLGQQMGARPIGLAIIRRDIVAQRPPQGMGAEREDEQADDDEKDTQRATSRRI